MISHCESVFYMRMETLRPSYRAVKNLGCWESRELLNLVLSTGAGRRDRVGKAGRHRPTNPTRPSDQKSNWALILANRADRMDVGPSQAPFGMNAWL